MSLAKKIGIIEKIKEIKRDGGKLSDFERFGVVKTEGSSQELHEWVDSFVPPLEKEALEKYYQHPELFLEYGRKNMELFIKICEVINEYARVVLDEHFSQREKDVAFLMAMHLTFTASDMIYKHDRFLEVFDPSVSPLGKVYKEINDILEKAAKSRYDEKWVEEKLFLLISMPTHISLRLKLLLDSLTIFKKYPEFKKTIAKKRKEEIISLIEKNAELYAQIKELANKYQTNIDSLMNIFLTTSVETLENVEKEINRNIERVKETFQELKNILSNEEYERLKKNYEKIRYFKELQEFTSLSIKKQVSMEAIGKMITAMDYFKENMTRFVKKEYIEEIRETLKSFEKSLPLGDFYFVPRLRKLIYLLLKKGFLKESVKVCYKNEVKIWEKI